MRRKGESMNIVIADDEQIILRWLKKNLEELDGGYRVVDVCTNGKQVLNCCLNQQVDVLFTDIRMPLMDGLELLRKLKANDVLPYTVILSAYSDFSYVRDAFRLGVSEFLLKPEITRENLSACMEAAKARIRQETLLEQKGDVLPELLGHYLRNPENGVSPLLAGLGPDFDRCYPKGFLIVVLSGEKIGSSQINEVLGFLLKEECGTYQCEADEHTVCFCTGNPTRTPGEFAEVIKSSLDSFGHGGISVSVSKVGRGVKALPGALAEAKEADAVQRFYGREEAVSKEELEERQEDGEQKAELFWSDLLGQAARRNWKELPEFAGQIGTLAAEGMLPPEYVKRRMIDFLMNLYWNSTSQEQRKFIAAPQVMGLSNAGRMGVLMADFRDQVKILTDLLQQECVRKRYSDSISKAVSYLEEHYAEDITLNDLAEHVHLNRSYLSMRFKKEVGDTIQGWLLEFRLKKAEKLLSGSNAQIQQICSEVGIPDSAYFSRQFRKYAGVSPLEYRKKQQL